MEKGIFVSCSAGNRGPLNYSLENESPWVLTAGASTIDRKIRASAMLGNNQIFEGESAYQPKDFASTLFPLVYPGSNKSDDNAPYCAPESINKTDVKGKIVLCYTTLADAHVLPAIVTTADTVNLENKPIEDQQNLLPADVFATGSGNVNPSAANNPGLIYDIVPQDYIPYLCGLNYTNRRKYTRTVTNVGEANWVYTAKIVQPVGVNVAVEPTMLKFSELNHKLTYEVMFSPLVNPPNISNSQGSLTWTSEKYSVRSPIAVIIDTRLFQ
ncbi:hypothetical protein ACH5RR_038065 [Cinchona calisaya]|uniref:Subtilisin-like protease fibronectin type-III domain-containing protein n=1 Tax=Cinchona calisaya TaxID=153742 RepID=A0ABD2Y815_9GENT